MMTKLLSCVLFGWALALSAQATEVLNISYSGGFALGLFPDSCTPTVTGIKANAPNPDSCVLEIPIPVAVGHTVKQIAALHGTQGNGNSVIEVVVSSSNFKTMPGEPTSQQLFTFISTTVFPGMQTSNLMAQTGFPPYLSYPDAFVIQSDRVYRAYVYLYDSADFYGLKILYE